LKIFSPEKENFTKNCRTASFEKPKPDQNFILNNMTNQSNSQINAINESQVTTSKAEINLHKTNSNTYGN
jgi:hypothetical protein